MKLIAMLGSSRKDSVTEKLAEKVMEGVKDAGGEVVVYHVNDRNIKGCRGCGACRKKGTDCVLNDDMKEYFEELRSADALLVSSPNYFSQVTGPMITFMNRHYCLSNPDHTSRLEPGKKLVGVFAQGAPEGMAKYEEHYDWYLSVFARHMELAGKLVAGGNSDLEALMKEAYETGKNL